MNQEPVFVLSISTSIPDSEIEALSTGLRTTGELEELAERPLDLETIEMVLKLLMYGASATASLLKIADILITWRERVKKAGYQPQVDIQNQKLGILHLNSATDEEIREWFADME